jgi:sirohydrochlorin ferrochelatase
VSFRNSAVCFLFDNGSLRAESTLSLRRVAAALHLRTGVRVEAVSLLHSSNVPAESLGGEGARLLEPALMAYFQAFPECEVVVLPLFFGPSAALIDYVPSRLSSLRMRFPHARVRLASCLVDPMDDDMRLAQILADQVRAAAHARGWLRPKVILVDHGSPQAAVTEVRNHLGRQLRSELGDEIEALTVASMERREGEEYDFNEPLLATALRTPPFDHGEVVVALQFLSSGRHAGPGGDIATICATAEADQADLHTHMTAPINEDVRLVELLAERYEQARKR